MRTNACALQNSSCSKDCRAGSAGCAGTACAFQVLLVQLQQHTPSSNTAPTIGQGAQDAQELHARILLGELLQGAVAGTNVQAPLIARAGHEHLQEGRQAQVLVEHSSFYILVVQGHEHLREHKQCQRTQDGTSAAIGHQ
eukprot:1158748-Pelagomonas_calceolata.AAC.6